MQAGTSAAAEYDRARRACEDRLRRLRFGPRLGYEIEVLDGRIQVCAVDKTFEARFHFAHDYGHAVLSRGSYLSVSARVSEVLIDGIDIPPVYHAGDTMLNFVRFESDKSWRAPLPCGEIRFKEFLDTLISVVVKPDRSLRLAALGDDDLLGAFAETMAEEWAAMPRLLVRYGGEDLEVRVSNIDGELGMCRINEYTKLALVPHSLGARPEDARMMLELIRGDEVKQLAVLPVFYGGRRDVVIWSDEAPHVARAPQWPRAATGAASPMAAPVQPNGPLRPEVRELVVRYLGELSAAGGEAKALRQESPALLRCAENGVRVSGRGSPLRRGLERAGEFTISGGTRTFQYFIKKLVDDGVLARDCPDMRARALVFDELHDLNSIAVTRLCERYSVTLPTKGEGSAGKASEEIPREVGQPQAPAPFSAADEGNDEDEDDDNPDEGDDEAPVSGTSDQGGDVSSRPAAARSAVPPRDPRIAPRFLYLDPEHVWSPGGDDSDDGGSSGEA